MWTTIIEVGVTMVAIGLLIGFAIGIAIARRRRSFKEGDRVEITGGVDDGTKGTVTRQPEGGGVTTTDTPTGHVSYWVVLDNPTHAGQQPGFWEEGRLRKDP